MKNKIILAFFLLTAPTCFAQMQTAFDKALSEISTDISNKLEIVNKKKIVVLYITDISKQMSVAGKYLADVVSVNLVNNPGKFFVFDRSNLNEISEAKKLYAEGYIDAAKAQQLRKILGVDAIVIGNYTVLSSTIKLTLKALDSDNGFVIAASMKDLPIDGDAGALLGINISSNSGNNHIGSNRGFNDRPLNSNENYNNPETVNKECQTNNTGDYCFTNTTGLKLYVTIYYESDGSELEQNATLDPGQSQCFYNLKAISRNYVINKDGYSTWGKLISNGSILIEKCKSKTYLIK